MVLASAIGVWFVSCNGLPFYIIRLLDYFFMMREFVFIYSTV